MFEIYKLNIFTNLYFKVILVMFAGSKQVVSGRTIYSRIHYEDLEHINKYSIS